MASNRLGLGAVGFAGDSPDARQRHARTSLAVPGFGIMKQDATRGPEGGRMVSVIIPTYNCASYVAEAVASVLVQTVQDVEIIVVDDGSTDTTPSVLEPFRHTVQYVRQGNRGVSAARNIGMAHAAGDFIAFLDADDIWLPNKLELQLQFLRDHRDVALVFGDAEHFDGSGTVIPSFLRQKTSFPMQNGGSLVLRDAFRLLLEANYITTSTVVITRACLKRVGVFDESLRSVEDRDLWLRVARAFPIGCVVKSLVRKRTHASNISSNGLVATQSLIHVLERVASDSFMPKGVDLTPIRKQLAKLYFQLGYCHFDTGRYRVARQSFRLSLVWKLGMDAMVYYLATFLGDKVVMWVRGLRQGWRRCALHNFLLRPIWSRDRSSSL